MLKTLTVCSFALFNFFALSSAAFANGVIDLSASEKTIESVPAEAAVTEVECENTLVATPVGTPVANNLIEEIQLGSLATAGDIEREAQKIAEYTGKLSQAHTQTFMSLSVTEGQRIKGYAQLYGKGVDGKNLSDLYGEFNELAPKLQPPESFLEPTASMFQSGYRALMKRFGGHLPPTVREYLATYNTEKPRFEEVLNAFQFKIDEVQNNKERATGQLAEMWTLINSKKAEREQLVQQRNQAQAAIDSQKLPRDLHQKAVYEIVSPFDALISALDEHIKAHSALAVQKKAVIDQTDLVVANVARTVSITVPVIRNSADIIADAVANQMLQEASDKTREHAMRSIEVTSRVIAQTSKQVDTARSQPVLDNTRLSNALRPVRQAMIDNQQVTLNLPGLIAQGEKSTAALQADLDALNSGQLILPAPTSTEQQQK